MAGRSTTGYGDTRLTHELGHAAGHFDPASYDGGPTLGEPADNLDVENIAGTWDGMTRITYDRKGECSCGNQD